MSYSYNNAGGHPWDARQAVPVGTSMPGAGPHNEGQPASSQSPAGSGVPQQATGASSGIRSVILVALVIPLCILLVAIGGIAFIRPHSASPSSDPTPIKTVIADQYSADVMNGKFHIESTSVTRGPVDQDGADTVLVTLTMTNNTDDAEFIVDHFPYLEQHGVDLDFAKLDHDQYPDVVVEMNDDKIEPGETRTLVVGFKYIYVGEPVVFVTQLWLPEHAIDFPQILVQPS